MPKFQRNKIQDEDEPLKKQPKVRVQRSPQIKTRQHLKRKCVKSLPKAPLNICDLPTEILEKIIGNVNIWHHNRIRGTSKRMKDVNDVFVMHEFQKASKKAISENPCSYESAALRSIRQATEVYTRSGFESTFCGCILPMLRSSYKDPFCPQVHQINKFLVHFFGMIEELIGDINSQYSRLLYNLTLMRFLKAFDTSNIISSTTMPLHWRTVVELKGPWLGILWTSKHKPRDQPGKRSDLLVILSEMLMASISGRSFKRVWECLSEIYVFGNDTSNVKTVPRTLFTFTVHGSKKICSLFRSCLEDDPDKFQWPTKWPKDQFTVNLNIVSKEAMKWGCSKSQHMEFGPFGEASYSDGEDDNFRNKETCNNSNDYVFE